MNSTLLSLRWENVTGFTDLNRRFPYRVQKLATRPPHPLGQPLATGRDAYNGSFSVHQIIDGVAYDYWEAHLWNLHEEYARVYDKFLGPWFQEPMPEEVVFPCCAQFAVTADEIRSRPKAFYSDVLRYMRPQNNDIRPNNHNTKTYVVGDCFMIYWHMIFTHAAEHDRGDAECTKFANC
jgi:hypothetical protein